MDQNPLTTQETKSETFKTLQSSIAKLSGSSRTIPCNKDFHFYFNFQDFKNPVQEIDQNSQKLLESIGSSAESIFSKKNMKFVNDEDDDDVGYDWLVNFNDEVFERFDASVDEFKKIRNKQEESGVKVMDSMENDGFQLVQNRKKKDVLGSESSVVGGENLGNLASGVKVAVGTPKAKVSIHNASIRRLQDEYKILVNNGNEPFEHVWLDRSEDGTKFIHPLEKLSVMDFIDEAISDLEESLKKLAAKSRDADEFATNTRSSEHIWESTLQVKKKHTGLSSTTTMEPTAANSPKVIAYWDMENVQMSATSTLSYYQGVKNFKNVIKTIFPTYPLAVFKGYGSKKYPLHQQLECQYAGLQLMHVPSEGTNAVDLSLTVDLYRTAISHPPPSIVVLIAGDADYSLALKKLKERGYTTILVYPDKQKLTPILAESCDYSIGWGCLYDETRRKVFTKWVLTSSTSRAPPTTSSPTLLVKKPLIDHGDPNVVTLILWDTDACPMDRNAVTWDVIKEIKSKLAKGMGLEILSTGKTRIRSYGTRLPSKITESLNSCGVHHTKATHQKHETVQNLMMADILTFAWEKRDFKSGECTVLLITDDKDLSMAAHLLADNNHKVFTIVPKLGGYKYVEESGTLLYKWSNQN